MGRRCAWILALALMHVACKGDAQSAPQEPLPTTPADWPRFGVDAGRSNAFYQASGIGASNVATLRRQQVELDGVVDASAVYLHDVTIKGATHDAFFVTTSYGKTIAIDADSGTILWRYTPASYDEVAGTYRITTATPVADPDRSFIYAASPDGHIQKLLVADGSVVWSTPITSLPQREKIASALNFWNGRVIAVTGGYIGDAPPYQGHVAILDAASGRLLHVWNSLCSDQAGLIDPKSCPESDSAIWGRAGAVIDTTNGHIFVATGNGRWNGQVYWGDAVIELDADATRIAGNYAPTNTDELEASDGDLGSTSPVLLGNGLVVQSGKDGKLRLLDWTRMQGNQPHQGGELQILSTPSQSDLFTAPAVWRDSSRTLLVLADNGGVDAWLLSGRTLTRRWHDDGGGTSPVIVNGLAYVYGRSGGLRVYDVNSGRLVTELACGGGHWNTPIIVDGRIALPEGSSNSRATHGVLNIWRAAH